MTFEEKKKVVEQVMDLSREMAIADAPIVLQKMLNRADKELVDEILKDCSEEVLEALIFQMGMPFRMMIQDRIALKLDEEQEAPKKPEDFIVMGKEGNA